MALQMTPAAVIASAGPKRAVAKPTGRVGDEPAIVRQREVGGIRSSTLIIQSMCRQQCSRRNGDDGAYSDEADNDSDLMPIVIFGLVSATLFRTH